MQIRHGGHLGGYQMDQARVDTFLDEGWCLIGQLHRWLSNWPMMSYDRPALVELIRGLQSLWASADDLGLKRLSRNVLALEQILERICARSLAFTGERLEDVTTGIAGLQDLLLGFETTQQEPAFSRLDAILKIERHACRTDPPDPSEVQLLGEAPFPHSSITDSMANQADPAHVDDDASTLNTIRRLSVDPNQIKLLEQLAIKLDDTCHRLHARILADEAPYMTSTSRLKHLSEETRGLVDQIAHGLQYEVPNSTCSTEQVEPVNERASEPAADVACDVQDSVCRSEKGNLVVDDPCIQEAPPTILANEVALTHAISAANEVKMTPFRVLILESSIFYRHLAATAIRSAGFEPVMAESIEQGRTCLLQSSDVGAIVTGSELMRDTAEMIRRQQSLETIPVILMSDALSSPNTVLNCDAHVSRKHPQQLVAVLERLWETMARDRQLSA